MSGLHVIICFAAILCELEPCVEPVTMEVEQFNFNLPDGATGPAANPQERTPSEAQGSEGARPECIGSEARNLFIQH